MLYFGDSGSVSYGHLSSTPSRVFNTFGLANVNQPYVVIIPDNTSSVYEKEEQMTKPVDPIINSVKLSSAESEIGHGLSSEKKEVEEQKSVASEKEEASGEEEKLGEKEENKTMSKDELEESLQNPVRVKEINLKRPSSSNLEMNNTSKKKKKKLTSKHKFNVI